MDYAKIEGGIVTSIIVADAEFIVTQPGDWVDVSGMSVQVGYTYSNGNFSAPSAPPAVARKVLSAQEWVATWTPEEWRTMKSDATLDSAEGKELDQLLDQVKSGVAIDLDSTLVVPLYDFLETESYITPERREELTAGIGGQTESF